MDVQHTDLTSIHPFAIVSASDPGSIGAKKAWVDTTVTPHLLKIRDAANTGWEVVGIAALNLDDIANVDAASPTNHQVLAWITATSKWEPYTITIPSVPAVLDDLTDVVIASPANNQVLKYDSATSKWINAAPSGGTLAGDVTGAAATTTVEKVRGRDVKNYPVTGYVDDFSTWTPGDWDLTHVPAGSTVNNSGGFLNAAFPNSGQDNSFNYIQQVNPFNFTGRYLQIYAIDPTYPNYAAYAAVHSYLYIYVDASNYIYFHTRPYYGVSDFNVVVGGSGTSVDTSGTPTGSWQKFFHDTTAHTFKFYTAPDVSGSPGTWTQIASIADGGMNISVAVLRMAVTWGAYNEGFRYDKITSDIPAADPVEEGMAMVWDESDGSLQMKHQTILKSPDGTLWTLEVDNAGVITAV